MGMGLGCLGALFFFSLIFLLPIEDGSWSIFLLLVGVVGSALAGGRYDSKRKINFGNQQIINLKNFINKIEDFTATQEFIAPNFDSYIGIDENSKKVCIIENAHKNHGELSKTLSKFDYNHNVYSFSEIIQSEIIKDGVMITKTSRGNQIGGALIGGAIAGGVGAIIGGSGAATESKSTDTSLVLQIVVNNAKNSIHRVTFMSPYDLGAFITGDETKKINHWHNLLTHIIDRTDENVSSRNPSPITTLSDDLIKLNQLKNEGILTEEEFNIQKQKILSN